MGDQPVILRSPRITLSASVSSRLRDRFAAIPDPAQEPEQAIAMLLQTVGELPTDTVRLALTLRADPLGAPALVLSGMPIDDDLPPTPTSPPSGAVKPGHVSDLSILLAAVLLGDPVAYLAEKDGALVQNVFPLRTQQDAPSNESSRAALDFHTELTFSRTAPTRPLHEAAPDFVLLLCLRCPTDRLATTAFVASSELCGLLDADQLATLREPHYQLLAPYSFTYDDHDDRPWSPPVPLLRGPAEAPSLAFDSACGTRALTPDAQAALDALSRACEDGGIRQGVELRAGDLLVLDNRRCAHARSSFRASYDGQDRWLQRAYVRRGIWPVTNGASRDVSFRVLT